MSALTERFIELRDDGKTLGEIAKITGANYYYVRDICRKHRKGVYVPPKKNPPKQPAPETERTCPICGKVFYAKGGRKYCSEDCRKKGYIEIQRKNHPRKEKQLKYCPKCGKSFYGHGKQKFCSKKCGKAYGGIGRRYTSSKDERLKDAVAYDKSVNLHTLIKRDNNVCQICGGECDLYDYEVTSSGVMLCGDTYPTIDHIKPCSLGGSHTWDNVQLACLKCNREKSDTYEI